MTKTDGLPSITTCDLDRMGADLIESLGAIDPRRLDSWSLIEGHLEAIRAITSLAVHLRVEEARNWATPMWTKEEREEDV
jgi:hypothetical protein